MELFKKRSILLLLVSLVMILLETGCVTLPFREDRAPSAAVVQSGTVSLENPVPRELIFPIDRAIERVTKKTFGMKISPDQSPVSPERFTGYHSGVDFETFPSEQGEEVVIRSICTGPLLLKKWATGYGWVAVQSCQLNKKSVTIVYGHLKLESIATGVNSVIRSGQRLGILGKWFGHETDGERKHLHLSIHSGSAVNIQGYTATKSALEGWLDPMEYFPIK